MVDCIHFGTCTICSCENKPALFQKLNREEFNELHFGRKEVYFNAGEIIFKQGNIQTHFACFQRGLAKVYFERPEGNNMLFNIAGPGRLCGSLGLYIDNVHHVSVQALTDAKICMISVRNIERALGKSKDMSVELVKLKNNSIMQLTNKLASLTYKSMQGRVADVLLFLQDEIYKKNAFDLNLSRQDLADLSAMTKESFIRKLKELKDAQIIKVKRDHIEIKDKDALRRISYN